MSIQSSKVETEAVVNEERRGEAAAAPQLTTANSQSREVSISGGTGPSITYLQGSQGEGETTALDLPNSLNEVPPPLPGIGKAFDGFPDAKAAIDWLEVGMLIDDFLPEPSLTWQRVRQLREEAKEKKEPVAYRLADQEVLIHPFGIGSGRVKHLELRIEWPGVMLALSETGGEKRQQANGYLKVSGEACLLHGALNVRKQVGAMLDELGLYVIDEWFKRIDVCLDIPDVGIDDWIVPSLRSGACVISCPNWNIFFNGGEPTGVKVGSPARAQLTIYDKVCQLAKTSEAYQIAMIKNRWKGRVPQKALRVEYQIRKTWLDQFGVSNVRDTMKRLPDIIARLTEPQAYPLFCVTQARVDRVHKHQGRRKVHPEWQRLVDTFRDLIGQPAEPLQRVNKEALKMGVACRAIIGYATTAAARLGAEIVGGRELGDFVSELIQRNDISDENIWEKWLKKAQKEGTVREPRNFPFGDNSEGEVL